MPTVIYNFGMSQEDEQSELAALEVDAGARVLSICSAGEMPLSLLALGAGRVHAIDVDANQLHLAQLKRAAVARLERRAAIRLLGYLPAPADERRRHFQRLADALPAASRAFWLAHQQELGGGVIWAGRYERYVRRLVTLLNLVLRRRIEGLFECTSLAQQEAYFGRAFDTALFRGIFELAFHPRIYAHRGMDPRSLQHRARSQPSLGQQYFQRFRALCTRTLVRQNYLLQLHLLGRVLGEDAVPAYLSAQGFARAHERLEALTLQQTDLVTHLRQTPRGTYDRLHLSNLPDWMDQPGFEEVMHLIAQKVASPGRAVWRYIHVDRPVPDGLRDRIAIDEELGRRLLHDDRFPFYTIVPAQIRAPGADPGAARAGSGPRTRTDAPDGFHFRPLDRSHGPRMLEINRRCPIEADFTFFFDRDPDFFAWPEHNFDSFEYTGIFEGERLVGYGMTGLNRGLLQGDPARFFYLGDWRILPGARGSDLGRRAGAALVKSQPADVALGYGLVKQGNTRAEHIVSTTRDWGWEILHLCTFEAVNVFLLGRPRPPRRYRVRRARVEDIEAMAAVMARAWKGRLFAPPVTPALLKAELQRLAPRGLGVERFYLAEDARGIVGLLGAWDTHPYRRTHVLGYSPRGKLIRLLYGQARRLLREMAPLPRTGQAFRGLTLTRMAIPGGAPAVLEDLLRQVLHEHAGAGYHMLHAGFSRGDPLLRAVRVFPAQRFISEIHLFKKVDLRLPGGPGQPWIDLARI